MPDALESPSYAQAQELPDAGAPVTSSEILHGYKIEARFLRPGQEVHLANNSLTINNTWRSLPVLPGKDVPPQEAVVIPVPDAAQILVEHGILPYAAAQAHRWAFHSSMSALNAGLAEDIETRLVLVTFKHAFEIIEVGVTEGCTEYDAEMDQIPLHERAAEVSEDEAPQPANDDAALAGNVDAVSAETLGTEAYDDADAAMSEFLEGEGNADLAEEPPPKRKGKVKAQGAKPASKKKKG